MDGDFNPTGRYLRRLLKPGPHIRDGANYMRSIRQFNLDRIAKIKKLLMDLI